MKLTKSLSGTGLAMLASFWLGLAQAEAPKQQDQAVQQVLRKAQGALRQLSEEKAQLEADKTALEKEKAGLQEKLSQMETRIKELEPLQGEVERQKASLEALNARATGLEGQLGGEKQKGEKLHGKLKTIVGQAKQIQADNFLLVEAVKERELWIGQCQQKNQAMLDTNSELLSHYQEKGFFDKLAEVEPLTGIGKVQTENTVQDFHYKLQDLKVTPFQTEMPNPQQVQQATQGKAQPALDDDEEPGD